MPESARIAQQLKASFEGPAWSGPSLKDVLANMAADVAARHPIPGAHSIWEIVVHVTVWAGVAHRTIAGAPYVSLEGPEDWPAPTGSWQDALGALEREQRALIDAVRGLEEARLDEIVSQQKGYSMYTLLHGVAQHNFYHAGQIALLRKNV
jgi:uncharacterized damage-inducible protein DinB